MILNLFVTNALFTKNNTSLINSMGHKDQFISSLSRILGVPQILYNSKFTGHNFETSNIH